MLILKNKIIVFAFLLISCKNPKNSPPIERSERYTIVYNFEVSFELTVYEGNDTIHIFDNGRKKIKVKSDQKTINLIKKIIVDHIQLSGLYVDQSKRPNSEGLLFMSISNKDNSLIINQKRLTYKSDSTIVALYQYLKNKHKL